VQNSIAHSISIFFFILMIFLSATHINYILYVLKCFWAKTYNDS